MVAEIESLTEGEVIIPWKKIKFADLKEFPISAADLILLEDVLDIDEESMGATPTATTSESKSSDTK